MVTLDLLSAEDPIDSSPLLSEAAETSTVTRDIQRQREVRKQDPNEFFLNRTQNLTLSLVLLLGWYSVILIPAYFYSDKFRPVDDYRETKDLVLLNQSASLLSSPCQPRWCLDHLKPLSCSTDLLNVPVFVGLEERQVAWDLPPPLGLRGTEEQLALALSFLPQLGQPASLEKEGGCRRCVVVGSGGLLHGSHLGSHIDQYDTIIRLNNAPVLGFERDAGSRTTIRLIYPEGAPQSPKEYQDISMVALVVFKSQDLDWLTSVVTKKSLSFWSKLWFWRDVVENIPLGPEHFRILHPEIVHKTGRVLQTYTQNQGKTVPTLGASAVVMALQLCDQISLAGFGYDMQHPKARLHYYETIRMNAMRTQVVHDVSAEKLFLRDLVVAGAVTDLTGAL